MDTSSDAPVKIRRATPADAVLLLQLIRELAEYERLSDEMIATPEQLLAHTLGPNAIAEAVIAQVDEETAGYAVYFPVYSTFAGVPHLYLEDIFVRPQFRTQGIGKALMKYIANVAAQRGYARMDWLVLNWNEPAIAFYQRLGAKPINKGWTSYSLRGESLSNLANS
jgi:GNAT superfamily N-acetyltransferase